MPSTFIVHPGALTRRQALLQLLRLVRILQHQRVQQPMASDLELDLRRLLVALDPGG